MPAKRDIFAAVKGFFTSQAQLKAPTGQNEISPCHQPKTNCRMAVREVKAEQNIHRPIQPQKKE
jgi:DNA-binding transcriptional regulator GbsR (MarR family)